MGARSVFAASALRYAMCCSESRIALLRRVSLASLTSWLAHLAAVTGSVQLIVSFINPDFLSSVSVRMLSNLRLAFQRVGIRSGLETFHFFSAADHSSAYRTGS